jgi:hypothetical protein
MGQRGSVCQTIDHERKGIRGLSAGCINFFLSRRIVPGLCFLGAVERDYDKSLGWGSIKTRNFIGPDDELAAGTGQLKSNSGTERGPRIITSCALCPKAKAPRERGF